MDVDRWDTCVANAGARCLGVRCRASSQLPRAVMTAVVLTLVGIYLVGAGVTGGSIAHWLRWEGAKDPINHPGPWAGGVFWPLIGVPLLAGLVTTRLAQRRLDRRLAARKALPTARVLEGD